MLVLGLLAEAFSVEALALLGLLLLLLLDEGTESKILSGSLTPNPLSTLIELARFIFLTSLSLSRTMSSHAESTVRPEPDQVLQDIADYVHNFKIESDLAFETARLCLIDTIGCGLEGLRFDTCSRLLGPVVEGTVVPNGM